MQYFFHTLTIKRRNIKRWHNPAHNFKSHSLAIRVSNYIKSIKQILYTPLIIEGRVELINRFYSRTRLKGEGIILGNMSSLRVSNKGKNYTYVSLLSAVYENF